MNKVTKIMIVDDDSTLVMMMEGLVRMVSPGPVDIRMFMDPQLAIDAIKSEEVPFDLVVTDYQMPSSSIDLPRGKEGGSIAKAANDKSIDTHVVIMSGRMYSALNEIKEVCTAHVCLQKPFSTAALGEAIRPAFYKAPVTV